MSDNKQVIEIDIDKAEKGSLVFVLFSIVAMIAFMVVSSGQVDFMMLLIPLVWHFSIFYVCPLLFGAYIIGCSLIADLFYKNT